MAQIKQISVRNFRCFRERQTARVAPLTLLVGENSTGKTSFMAMVRALWDVIHAGPNPSFKRAPYDLGSFPDIVHYRSDGAQTPTAFEAGFRLIEGPSVDVKFGKAGTQPIPVSRRIELDEVWIEQEIETKKGVGIRETDYEDDSGFFALSEGTGMLAYRTIDEESDSKLQLESGDLIGRNPTEPSLLEAVRASPEVGTITVIKHVTKIGNTRGAWKQRRSFLLRPFPIRSLYPIQFIPHFLLGPAERVSRQEFVPLGQSPEATNKDVESVAMLAYKLNWAGSDRIFASAPVRSKPRRTYDPADTAQDPEGDYIPMYLAEVFAQNSSRWGKLKVNLEAFGSEAGLFDEIAIHRFGASKSGPFQVLVKRSGSKGSSSLRNLLDVGYGVSQVLPVVAELLRPDAPGIALLQQPEVHLHASAQAALASFFCKLASEGRQLLIETHGTYLIDRVRLDIRDKKTRLRPEDVSILYFEHRGSDVQIHSIRLDDLGNVWDAPKSYGRFFLDEATRSLEL